MSYRLLFVLCFIHCNLVAQEINLQLRDSLSGAPVPFATIITNFGENTVSNEEGVFRLFHETSSKTADSIFISSMGFRHFKEALHKLADSLLFLSPKAIELNAVILSQNNLSAAEIVKRAREKVAQKYDLSFTKKTFFLRESYAQRWLQSDMKIKKSTIKKIRHFRYWMWRWIAIRTIFTFRCKCYGY